MTTRALEHTDVAKRTTKKKSSAKTKKQRGGENGPIAVIRERVALAGESIRTWFADAGIARWTETAGWLVVVVGILLAWTMGVPRLETKTRDAARVEVVQVRLIDPPSWLEPSTVRDIQDAAARDLAGDPFDRDELIIVGRVVHGSGWFDEIEQVRRTAPDEIQVRARPLVPIAFVRQGGFDQLVDVAGRVLPHELAAISEPERREGLTVITGVAARRPDGVAPRWGGAELQAALSLLAQLEARPWREQVAIIDASQFTEDGTLDFMTDAGSVFKWGSPPGAEKPLEPSVARKLEMLDVQHAGHPSGRIDRGEDLRWWFYDDRLTNERTGD